ncbi:MAG: toll/interleukin-1 receptor domain-containing protein [Candidatus Omnitrophica bacterium]|nr:toll/interleukin-1 receptor domain-containing protein [Candidatus Omnitrophota bacterium]
MENTIKAIAYIENFLHNLLPYTEMEFKQIDNFHWRVFLKNKSKEAVINFDRDRINDFEEAIQKYDGTDYFYGLQSDINFRIYIPLGKAGMINDFDIVSALIEERRDWIEAKPNNITQNTFSAQLTEAFFRGLKRLKEYLEDIIRKYGDGYEEIKKDRDDIDNILNWYDKNKSFICDGVNIRNLSLLKASLISEIIDKIKQKQVANVPQRVLDKIEHDIYALVEESRKPIFLNIKPPLCIAEYRSVVMPKKQAAIKDISYENKTLKVFISYSTKNKTIAGRVKTILERYDIESFLAHEDINITEEWKKRIMLELREANVFIAILSKDFKDSDWSPQESGMAYLKNILIISLLFDDIAPFGFLGDSQGKRIKDNLIPLEYIIKPIVNKFPNSIIDKIINKLEKISSFREAEEVFDLFVAHFERLNQDQINKVVNASIKNGQIWSAAKCRTEYLPHLLKIHKDKISHEQYEILSYQIEKSEFYRNGAQNNEKEPWVEIKHPWLTHDSHWLEK